MNCERMQLDIPELLAGRLDDAARRRLLEHLEICSACRAQAADLGPIWRDLEAMSEAEPGPAMRSRFMDSLAAWQEGFEEGRRKPAARPSWFRRPVWQVAFATLLLTAGALAGRYLLQPRPEPANPEIAELRGQVENLRQIMALSLLQEQSAGSRLRGVTYSYQVAGPDRQVEQALLFAVNHDSNVNVRLSAVDALGKFAAVPGVGRALADSLAVQDSPLVQVAVVDLLAQMQTREAAPALARLAHNQDADEAVRQRAAAALEKLGGMQ